MRQTLPRHHFTAECHVAARHLEPHRYYVPLWNEHHDYTSLYQRLRSSLLEVADRAGEGMVLQLEMAITGPGIAMRLARTFLSVRSAITRTLVFAMPDDTDSYYIRGDLDGILLSFLDQMEPLVRQSGHIVSFAFSASTAEERARCEAGLVTVTIPAKRSTSHDAGPHRGFRRP